jgi:hypothetical protein
MNPRCLDVLLLLLVLAGGLTAWLTGRERTQLQERYDRLVQIAGELPIADPSLVYIQALETREPLHFAWRVYLPPNCRSTLQRASMLQPVRNNANPSGFIARLRFRLDEQDRLRLYTNFLPSGEQRVYDKVLTALLCGRWDAIHVEQLGAPGLVVLKPGQPATLLRLTLPERLQAEARQTLGPTVQNQFVPVLFELGLQPSPPKP